MSEIKDIPEHWEITRLGDVCDLQNGVAFKSRDYVEFSKTLVFRMSQIRPGGILDLNHNSKYLPDSFNETYKDYRLKESDVVIAMTDMATETRILGVPTFFKSDGRDYLLNQRVGRLFNINKEKINVLYLRYVLTAPIINRYYKTFGKGALQINLGKNDILNAQIPLPPLPEQQAIVAKIEELLSELDNGKQQLQTALQQLKVYRQSLLKWHYDKSVGSVPIKLVDVCEFITKGTTPSKDKLLNYKGDVPFLKVYNLTFNGTIDFSKDPTFVDNETHNVFLKRSRVYPNDVLMNIVGPPLGKVSIVPDTFPEWNINQAIVRFRCKTEILPKYLLHFLLCEYTIRTYSRKAKATAGQFNLTLEICRDIEIPLPPISEQQLIVDELESKLTLCDNVEETIKLGLLQAETLRQSILKQAFEGKLV